MVLTQRVIWIKRWTLEANFGPSWLPTSWLRPKWQPCNGWIADGCLCKGFIRPDKGKGYKGLGTGKGFQSLRTTISQTLKSAAISRVTCRTMNHQPAGDCRVVGSILASDRGQCWWLPTLPEALGNHAMDHPTYPVLHDHSKALPPSVKTSSIFLGGPFSITMVLWNGGTCNYLL